MSTATPPMIPEAPAPLEILGPVARVPSLDELRDLTDISDRRVVFRCVDWAFYEELVDSIPEYVHIHVDYDGRDLEILSKGILHERARIKLDRIVSTAAEVYEIRFKGAGQTTWKRREIGRGLESDHSYYFLPEKLTQSAVAFKRRSNDVANFPNPDLAIEVDITPPQTDRAGIYAALHVAEVWRFDRDRVVIERLTLQGTYEPIEASGFVPVRIDDVRRWVIEEECPDDTTWGRRLRAEFLRKKQREGL